MPRRYPHPEPHPRLTPASRNSQIEIEEYADTSLAYALNDGPWRVIAPAPYGLYNVLRQLTALIHIHPSTPPETAELRRIERELHEDVLAYEREHVEREHALLYARTAPPPLVLEPAPGLCRPQRAA